MKRARRTSGSQLQLWDRAAAAPASWEGDRSPSSLRGLRVHLVGAGGIGMSGIAHLLQSEGCVVDGCDAGVSEITDALTRSGVRIRIGHSPNHVAQGVDMVVVSAAIRETNPELRAARRRNIPVLKYAELLGRLMSVRDGVAVSGSHGKTTTTSMIAYAMNSAGRNPSMLIGGLVPQLGGNARHGDGMFVVEACEYDRSFLNLRPKAAVITNIDRDHLDYYADLDELVEAFGDFASGVTRDGLIAVSGDDPNALRAAARSSARVETFGQDRACDWRVTQWERADGRTTFRAAHKGRRLKPFTLLGPGFYNVRNALACIAVCRFFGVPTGEIRDALATFRGTRRRFDHLGDAAGVSVFDDYGHHPTEVRLTLQAARQEFPDRRLWCVFQPHQCSRTRILMDDFAAAFSAADRVIVPDIYSVRDSARDRAEVHARDLVHELRSNGVEAAYGAHFPQVVDRLLGQVERGDLVMTMGAGPVDSVGRSLLDELRKREETHGLA